MKMQAVKRLGSIAVLMTANLAYGAGFNSGSTAVDGDFNPTENTVLTMPDNGVFNFGSVNIPAGVKVSFLKNGKNTPVIILASGNVVIAGTLDVSGGASSAVGVGVFNDLGGGGKGGPGGFDGGRGGQAGGATTGGTGMGPGGGMGGLAVVGCYYTYTSKGGGGGGFATAGMGSYALTNNSSYCNTSNSGGAGGAAYGSASVLPMVGGSGGGGGTGATTPSGYPGTGGGGGGGALLIAASGSVTLTGAILATGGNSGKPNSCDVSNSINGGAGGGGAGGAVRILAPNFSGGGSINVAGGNGRPCGALGLIQTYQLIADGGHGSIGRVSIETVTSGTLRLTGLPIISVSKIGGLDVPTATTGAGDVVLPPDSTNPVDVVINAQSVPVGTVIKLTLSLPYGAPTVVNSSPLAGTYASSTATASINIPQGATVLIASTTYTLTLAQGTTLAPYAGGEQVARVELASAMGGQSKAVLITVSGKQYEVSPAVLALAMS